jgi:uncharacterized protein
MKFIAPFSSASRFTLSSALFASLTAALLTAASLSVAAVPQKAAKPNDRVSEAAAAAAATNALIAAETRLPTSVSSDAKVETKTETKSEAKNEVKKESDSVTVKSAKKNADETKPAPVTSTSESGKVASKDAAKATPATAGKSFLWEVKSKTNTVYLFGTIHLGKKEFYPLPTAVEDAFTRAKIVVVEADITKAEDGAEIDRLISYTPPDNLEKQIPAPLYARLSTQLARLKFPPDGVKTMKPFLVGGFLAVAEFTRLGFDMKFGVDAYLLGKAQTEKKPILELESQLGQIKLLASLNAGQQEAFLDNSLQTIESDDSGAQINGLVKAWQTGDTTGLQEIAKTMGKRGKRSDELDEILIYSRHNEMIKKVETYLASNDAHFIAVGSLHLVGSRGLVDLLRAKGYQIRQL